MERSKAGDTPSSSGDTSSTSSSTSSSSTSASSTSSTSSTSSGGTPTDAFAGAPAFAAGTANGSSTNAGHGTNQNPAGLNCLSCHVAGGPAPAWNFAGTVYDSTGAAVVGAEVRGIDKTGKATEKLYTDANGNFWSEGTVKPVKVGVRNATKMMQMQTLLNPDNPAGSDMSCQRNTCHNSTGGQAKITL